MSWSLLDGVIRELCLKCKHDIQISCTVFSDLERWKHHSMAVQDCPSKTYKRFTYRETLLLPLCLCSMTFTWRWHIPTQQHQLWSPQCCWSATCAWREQMPQRWWFSGQRGCVSRDWETDRGRVWERCWSVAQETRVTRVTSCLCSFSLCRRGREKREEMGGGGIKIMNMGSGSCPSCMFGHLWIIALIVLSSQGPF